MTITLTISVPDDIDIGEALGRLHQAAVQKVMNAHATKDRQQVAEGKADAIVSEALLQSFKATIKGDGT